MPATPSPCGSPNASAEVPLVVSPRPLAGPAPDRWFTAGRGTGFTDRVSSGDATRRPARPRGSEPVATAPASGVRSLVAESWLRSSAAGVDPEAHLAPVLLEASDLADYRSTHALSHVFPLLYDVLGRSYFVGINFRL